MKTLSYGSRYFFRLFFVNHSVESSKAPALGLEERTDRYRHVVEGPTKSELQGGVLSTKRRDPEANVVPLAKHLSPLLAESDNFILDHPDPRHVVMTGGKTISH